MQNQNKILETICTHEAVTLKARIEKGAFVSVTECQTCHKILNTGASLLTDLLKRLENDLFLLKWELSKKKEVSKGDLNFKKLLEERIEELKESVKE